uniref:Putative transcriptional coactivator caper rrm superfamily n=1 Tax=Anopheles triannulatus TaxID=58253 RepID=A0A2M4AQ91_9DIPT
MADAAEDYPDHASDAINTSSKRAGTMRDDRGHSSSSGKRSERSGRYHDDYDYQRPHHRDHRSERDRYRDRDHRDYGSHHRDRDRDRKREEDRYQRSDHRRDRRTSRSPVEDRHGKLRSSRRSNSRDRDRSRERPLRGERTAQDRLSEEIEQELANLRRKHELAEALKKQQDPDESSDDGFQAKAHQMMNPCGSSKPDFLTGTATDADAGEYVPEIQTEEERIEFQRKMQEKLQQHLAAEGKLYPPRPPKSRDPVASAPVVVSGFANDGSFLEMFKKLQEQPLLTAATGTFPVVASTVTSLTDAQTMPMVVPPGVSHVVPSSSAVTAYKMVPGVGAPVVATAALGALSATPVTKAINKEPPPPPLPVFGRRRGGKILKTGLVKKVRPVEEVSADAPNDAWSLYLQEVKKYKSASCDADSKTRPLVK